MITFSPELKPFLPSDPQACFDYFMHLSGTPFREQPGRRTQRVQLGQKTYFLKQQFGVGVKEIFKNLVQLKWPIVSAKNEWRALNRLHSLGVSAPIAFAYGCTGWNPARLRSFILMEDIANAPSLETLCQSWKKQPPPFSLKQQLIQTLADIARTLHEHGINHRDFYLCHFLFEEKPFRLTLIDLHRAGLHFILRKRWRIKDLAGLYFSSQGLPLSHRDYFRFMKRYRQKPLRALFQKEKLFWQTVKQCGEKLYAKHR